MTHPSGLELRTKSVEESIVEIVEIDPTIALDYQPGNGTRYTLVLTQITNLGDEFLKCIGRQGRTWVVTWLNGSEGKSMTCGSGLVHFNYVGEKLRCSLSDAIVLAEIIGHLTKQEYVSCDDYKV